MKNKIWLLLFILIYTTAQWSCKKDTLLTDSNVSLKFSADTLLFDTVFVTIGSATQNLRIHNTYSQPIKISNIHLAGGNASNFRINVNGSPGTSFKDIELRAGDSLWVFAEVTVDPNQSNLPYIIKDSIVFETNGHIQDVKLVAWGQNAHFIIANKAIRTGTTSAIHYALLDTNLHAQITWDDQLPYVVYGGYAVVDSTQQLTINQNTHIYFSNNAGLWIYSGGTLKVHGTKDKPVIFQGMRLEPNYAETPGQWDRIWINDAGTDSSEIDYAIIKNGFIGIQTESLTAGQYAGSLRITNTFIRNMSGIGILSRNFKINAFNNVVSNCGQYTTALTLGGNYQFVNCTFANYWNSSKRSNPAVYLNNYAIDQNNAAFPINMQKAEFDNCIIYGDNDNELQLDFVAGADSLHQFHHDFVKADKDHSTSDPNYFTSVTRNINPIFIDASKNNYQLDSSSPCIDAGDNSFDALIPFDLKGDMRIVGTNVDLGAYERQ